MPQKPRLPQLILASGSPRRKQLLEDLDITFEICVSNVDENVERYHSPLEYVRIVAERKADAVRQSLRQSLHRTDGWILSADTTVVVDGTILGKPQDEDEALSMLGRLQGKTHSVITAICLMDTNGSSTLIDHRETKVTMKPLSTETLKAYIATGEPLDKAGAYGIQGLGSTLISGIEGDYFNVVGLSLSLLSDMFEKIGYSVLG